MTDLLPSGNNSNNHSHFFWGLAAFMFVIWLMMDAITKFLLIVGCFAGVALVIYVVYHYIHKPNTLNAYMEREIHTAEAKKTLSDLKVETKKSEIEAEMLIEELESKRMARKIEQARLKAMIKQNDNSTTFDLD